MTDFYPRRKELGRVRDIDTDNLKGTVWTLAMLNETLKENAYRLDSQQFSIKRDIEKGLYAGHEEDWRSFLDEIQELYDSMCNLQLRVEKVIWGLEEPAKLKTFDSGSNPYPGVVWGWDDIVCDLEGVIARTDHEIEVSYPEDVKHMRSFVGTIQRLYGSAGDLWDRFQVWHSESRQAVKAA